MIYADYAATTPLHPAAYAAMQPFLEEQFYNPSSISGGARAVRAAIERARTSVAALWGAASGRVVFTSGGTESDNLAIIGTALHPKNPKRHIGTSAVEHHAVLAACHWLETMGFRVTYLPVDAYGRVSPEALAGAMTEDTFLVSVMWVNNELGTVQPVRELASITHAQGALFHTDAVQAMTTQDIDVARDGIDLLSLSSHKIYGPKGCGVLYVREGVALSPIVHGGQQEGGLRGGTENAACIIGMGAAAAQLLEEKSENITRMHQWKQRLILELGRINGARINSPEETSACSVLNVAFRGVEAEGLLFWLSREEIQVSMGSACNSQSVEPSHVIRAIGLPEDYARGCIRISLGRGLCDRDIERLTHAISGLVATGEA